MSSRSVPKTQELFSSHIPALKTLMTLGYEFVSSDDCLAKRGNTRSVIMKEVLVDSLKQREFEYRGQSYPLSMNAIDQIVRELSSPGLNEGLLTANERFHDRLTLGVTVTESIGGARHSPTIPLIDWDNIENNVFNVTEEMEVMNTASTGSRRPDIICYVNGLPLVVIEAKKPTSGNPNKSMIEEGISQHIRNQGNGEIPQLFAYAQLLLSISGIEGRYGTTKTKREFYSIWRDEEFDEDHFQAVKSRALTSSEFESLFEDKPAATRAYFDELWQGHELPNEQDRLLIGLLTPSRLLELIRYFILFNRKFGKIVARYQQFFGVRAMVERVDQRLPGGGRQGGVIWHTTGSGKSFTMVYLCKLMLLHPLLKECRVIVVTDRRDLEKQLNNTFLASGAFGSEVATRREGERSKVRSGKDLARRIGKGTERIIFTIIDKFHTASKQPECYNPSENIIVLVDEGHRGHGGEGHQRMRKALPNAAFVAFTGTPLLKDDKTTNKFGSIIHGYTMQRAVEDHAVTPLLYEERQPELQINERAIDNWFNKITSGLSEAQKADLKKKYSNRGVVYGSEARIELIAWDIAVHFDRHIKALGTGLKGQVATDSKLSAVRYHKHLNSTGLVSSAVVISPPDTREGHREVDANDLPEVQAWWKANVVDRYADEDSYEREVVEDFSSEGPPDLLIVVDKLLTGFDEPRNTVLYIDKPLKEHNLIQAIARINRLREDKRYGLLIDYRGILEELDTSIQGYQDLASQTQSGYDIDDIDGLYHQMAFEYKNLPKLHDAVWDVFRYINNPNDREQFRQALMPDFGTDSDGHSYDKRQKLREDFYKRLTEFGLCLKVALASRSYFDDPQFSETQNETYKRDLKFFVELRQIAKHDAQETTDYSVYEDQIRKLVDKHVVGESIKDPEGIYLVGEMGDGPESWSEEKARNETDLIKTRVRKTIEQDLENDPYAKEEFSKLLQKAIQEAEKLFDHPLKQYTLFKEFEEQLQAHELDSIPKSLNEKPLARAYYGIFKLVLDEATFSSLTQDNILVDESLAIESLVDQAVSEHSLSSQNIEAAITKALLPRLYKLIGMDAAKEVIAQIIHVTRVGPTK